MGSRVLHSALNVAELPDQRGVAEFAGGGIPRSAERDRASVAGQAGSTQNSARSSEREITSSSSLMSTGTSANRGVLK